MSTKEFGKQENASYVALILLFQSEVGNVLLPVKMIFCSCLFWLFAFLKIHLDI